LQLGVGVNWNLIDGRRDLERGIAELGQKIAVLERDADRTRAFNSLRSYVQALTTYESAIASLRTLEGEVMTRRPHWTSATPAEKFSPNEIEPYLKHVEFVESRRSLEAQAEQLRIQLSKWTKIPQEQIAEGRIAFPGNPVPGEIPTDCVENSTNVRRAKLRLEQERLFEALRRDPLITVSLNVNGGYTSTPPQGQSGFNAQVSLTAVIPIPTGSPISGGAQVMATPNGVTQSATVSFPNASRSADPQGVKWAQKNLEETREALRQDLYDLLRARKNGLNAAEVNAQRLDWGERSYRESAGNDESVRLSARFALMGLKLRVLYDQLSLSVNALNTAALCQMEVTYVSRGQQ
jgi:hypothetical protein